MPGSGEAERPVHANWSRRWDLHERDRARDRRLSIHRRGLCRSSGKTRPVSDPARLQENLPRRPGSAPRLTGWSKRSAPIALYRCLLKLVRSEPNSPRHKGGMKMRGKSLTITITTASLAVVGGMALAAQDRFTLQIPNGLAFSEVRGYDTWQDVAVSQVKDGLKVIVANDVMINAYKEGVPGNGKQFPDGSTIVKIEWSQKKP